MVWMILFLHHWFVYGWGPSEQTCFGLHACKVGHSGQSQCQCNVVLQRETKKEVFPNHLKRYSVPPWACLLSSQSSSWLKHFSVWGWFDSVLIKKISISHRQGEKLNKRLVIHSALTNLLFPFGRITTGFACQWTWQQFRSKECPSHSWLATGSFQGSESHTNHGTITEPISSSLLNNKSSFL